MPHPTPRLFILRHGETEWSLSGKHTGTSDIPLTANGERRIISTGHALVGPDRLIVRENIAAAYVSPRTRAQRTLSLLMGGEEPGDAVVFGKGPDATGTVGKDGKLRACVTEDVAEWDYGDYEGRTSGDIKKERKGNGQDEWDIWRDGCPGGESPADVTKRLDRFISQVRSSHHALAFEHTGSKPDTEKPPPCDVLVVAHGHILRALAARWINRDIRDNPNLILEAGGVGCLSYEHNKIEEPAILLGGAFVVDIAASSKKEGVNKN